MSQERTALPQPVLPDRSSPPSPAPITRELLEALSNTAHPSAASDHSDNSIPSLETVSDSDESEPGPGQAHTTQQPGIYRLATFLDPWTAPTRRIRPAYIHLKIVYQTRIAELEGRPMIKLEIVANDTHAENLRQVIYLPTTLAGARALPPAVWEGFWADIAHNGLLELLDEEQHELIEAIIDIFRYYATLSPRATETWDDFLEELYLGAEFSAHLSQPGERVLSDLSRWAMEHIPGAFPDIFERSDSDSDGADSILSEDGRQGTTSHGGTVGPDEL
ncbi:hypothetical protein L226DRAFT_570693 [Lentinus tigrinus ALCF2SS1-7]|uniref:Uncharacterized protein n=1 Tax=Lentinus tigrinus ALCF2SS1-6 TaxID=1328759 RepID=A0A5C2SCD6_9APHY|nr:hypothetical protein L227DRAFT_610538 [Lentinus tigrinus ALCF2SS1-6]RPD75021.1 hypothetical protein L226DRAFT_570693 [Lentinus tigrinus ALCF2SS1-7]